MRSLEVVIDAMLEEIPESEGNLRAFMVSIRYEVSMIPGDVPNRDELLGYYWLDVAYELASTIPADNREDWQTAVVNIWLQA
jgi:hypothetical protein